MAATENTSKLSVIDESGLDALLEAVFSKLKEAYVSQSSFEEKIREIINSTGTGSGLGFIAFEIKEENGHLIMYYEGEEPPNIKINEAGHLIATL